MSNHYFTLKFDTEAEAIAAAEALALLPEQEPDADPPDFIVISQAGGRLFGQAMPVFNVSIPGTYDSESGEQLTPPTPVPGAFVNVILNRNILPSSLRAHRVPYGSAGQVWSGTEPEPGAWPATAPRDAL